jgi:hypothetical protein
MTALERIAADDCQRYNWLELKRAAYFDVAELQVVEVLAALVGYGFCILYGKRRIELIRRFCDFVMSLDCEHPQCSWPSEVGLD